MNIDELLKSNADLEEYLREYGENSEFLYQYYKQDKSRIIANYYLYCNNMKLEDKLKLVYDNINDFDQRVLNTLLSDFINLYPIDPDKCNEVFDEIVKLDKEGKINIDDLPGKNFICKRDPIYYLKKDIKYLNIFGYLKKDDLMKVLDYLNSEGYMFSEKDSLFLNYNVFVDLDNFIYFINNCNYSSSLNVSSRINQMSKEELLDLYPKIVNGKNVKSLLNAIYNKLNYENYDYNTIIKDRDIYLDYDLNKRDKITNLLKELKVKGFNGKVILKMDRVDMEYINQIAPVFESMIKISPVINQVVNDTNNKKITDIPAYDVDYIRKSEEKLDLYGSMVNDTKDKDGDIKSLSPLEKYVAAYILTTKFAPYKNEDKNDKIYASRAVYEFINSISNTKIVCAGYVHLLRELLYRMDIKDTIDWAVSGEEKDQNIDFVDHGRMLIHLVDPKYNIDGVYMSDPTWDNHDITKKSIDHMLMSHDELLKIDPNLTLEKLRADNTISMDKGLGINNSYELFRKPIPKDAIIKAHLAVEHFLDKNMKMSKDNNYDLLEYSEMATKLGYFDVYQNNKDEIIQELTKMSINEINYNYPVLLDDFIYDLLELCNKKLITFGVSNKLIGNYDHDNNRMLFGYSFEFQTEEFTDRSMTLADVNDLRKIIPLNRINKRAGVAKFYIQLDNDKKIEDQYDEVINQLCQLNEIITSNKEDNRLK